MPQLDPPLDLADLPVKLTNARPLFAKGLDHHRREPLRDPLQGRRDRTPYASPAFRHDLAELGQKAAQAVDLGGTELHQLLTHAVHCQDRLLLLALDRNSLDGGLLRGRPDRLGVLRIVLVAGHEGPDRLRRQ